MPTTEERLAVISRQCEENMKRISTLTAMTEAELAEHHDWAEAHNHNVMLKRFAGRFRIGAEVVGICRTCAAEIGISPCPHCLDQEEE